MQRKTAWRAHLADPEVRRWFDAMALRSEGTAEERLRILARYCAHHRVSPADLALKAQSAEGRRAVENELQDFVLLLRRPHKPADHGLADDGGPSAARCLRRHAPGYVENYVKAVRGWLRHNDVGLVRKIVIGDDGATPTVEDERPPTPDELRGVLSAAGLRGRVIIAFCAWSGLRPEVLGTKRATDGLRLADIPDLEVRGKRVVPTNVPMRVVVRRELSKVRRKYVTFLPAEGVEYLRDYLEHRSARGEALTRDSPIVRPDYGFDRKGRPADMQGSMFLGRQGVTKEIRSSFRVQGLRVRPYVLRSYFESALLSAEREGKVTSLDREFWMGRKGSVDMVYTNRKELSNHVIEQMRTAFTACEHYLTTRLVLSQTPLPLDDLTQMQLRIAREELEHRPEGFRKLLQVMMAVLDEKQGRG